MFKTLFFFFPREFLQSDKLELLRERMAKVRDLFRDSETTEFVIVTIPTVINPHILLFYLNLLINSLKAMK